MYSIDTSIIDENRIETNRMPAERAALAVEQEKTISPEQYDIVKGLATAIAKPLRSFLFRTPEAYGMAFESLTFPSLDGTPLEAWYIPAKGESNKLIIFNHALPMCRAGYPGHFGLPWAGFDKIEIDFVLHYKHLHEAGYNILTYDLRNHGQSGAANGGISGFGNFEWRDCVGAKQYVDSHPELSKMTVGLYSQCLGGMSQYRAIKERPELFANVRCMFSPLVPNMEAIYTAFSRLQGIEEYLPLLDLELIKMGGFTGAECGGKLWADAVTMPTLSLQVEHDSWTLNPEDGQLTFDRLASQEKDIIWVEGTRRFRDGYNYFGRHPERVLAFFAKHMA